VIAPFRATYGSRDNRHDLLDWDGQTEPPAELMGKTDKPPGYIGPQQRWWPAVGCGPLGRWWALWWTMPDEGAQRAGMARAEVAWWSLDTIGEINDVRPTLNQLSGEPILDPDPQQLSALADALIQGGTPPVLADLGAWPALLGALWIRMWPALRRQFSVRVVLGPPMNEFADPPMLLVSPASRSPQWPTARLVGGRGQTRPSRATRWLSGEPDATIDGLRHSGVVLNAGFGGLRRLARAAERLDILRANPDARGALGALRTLIAVAPTTDVAGDVKREALAVLVDAVPAASAELILALRNLDRTPLPDTRLPDAVRAWVAVRGSALAGHEIAALLSEEPAQPWWADAIRGASTDALTKPDGAWAAAVLRWLGDGPERLDGHLPTNPDVERSLEPAATRLEAGSVVGVLTAARQRGWSRLHARVLLSAFGPAEALRRHRRWRTRPDEGLRLMLAEIPPEVAVAEVVAAEEPAFADAVAALTVKAPELLKPLDALVAGWRLLWSRHIAKGGAPWPPGVDQLAAGSALLTAVIEGEPSAVLGAVAGTLGPCALDHPRRPVLWTELAGSTRADLLEATTKSLVTRCRTAVQPEPEPPLAQAAAQRATAMLRGGLGAEPFIVATLLSWDVPLDEREVSGWLRRGSKSDWGPVANAVGRALLRHGWRRAAKDLYGWEWHAATRPALIACRTLLDGWRRKSLEYWDSRTPETRAALSESLIHQVAQIGARLMADDEQLETLWRRIGGKRESLPSSKTPAVRWREAARLAAQGAIAGGLSALVAELQDEFEHNAELKTLRRTLDAEPG
jgi:hypothetical protein